MQVLQFKKMKEDSDFQLEKGSTLINGKYKVMGKVGKGTQSSVHAVTVIKGAKQVIRAIKVEASNVKEPQISTEIAVLKSIKEASSEEIGFVQLYQFGYEAQFNYMIVTLLGPSIDQLHKLCGGVFSLKTTLLIALQILDRLETLHSHGYVHCDIAPENFTVGLNSNSPFIFMIDFGRCRRFKNKVSGQHIPYKQNIHYPFNTIFGSINAHNNVQVSRRDDIQSLIYMIIFLKLGKLPWARNVQGKRSKADLNAEQLKKRLTPEMLCHRMPLQIIDIIYYIKSIEFYEKPDYDFIRKMFYRCLEREHLEQQIVYDWNGLQDIDFKVYAGEPKIVLKGHFSSEAQEQKKISRFSKEEEDDEGHSLVDN